MPDKMSNIGCFNTQGQVPRRQIVQYGCFFKTMRHFRDMGIENSK